MQKEILEELYKPFELKARVGVGNKTFKYVPSDDIVDRMNQVFMGDWSTEVVSSEVINDQILIRVRVYAKDPRNTDSKTYFHEGYASQLIAKYTQGAKTGQIIDVGNSYKSAMSKAIKTAVAKWGVGLYLEKGVVNEESNVGSWEPPIIVPAAQPKIDTVVPAAPIVSAPVAPVSAPVAAPVVPVAPVAAPINTPPGMSNPIETPIPSATVPPPTPVFTDANVVVTQPNQTANFAPPIDSVTGNGDVEKLTDVQKVAIENIMSVHTKTFAELSAAALQRTDNLPTDVESLSYQDAVKLIQYGNNLNTGS